MTSPLAGDGPSAADVPSIDHIGVAVESLEESIPRYEKLLGVRASGVEEVASEKVRVAFFELAGFRVELLEPTADDSPIRGFLDRGKSGVHHVALRAPTSRGIDAEAARLEDEGVQVLGDGVRPGSGGSRVLFVHPRAASGVLFEWTEHADAASSHGD